MADENEVRGNHRSSQAHVGIVIEGALTRSNSIERARVLLQLLQSVSSALRAQTQLRYTRIASLLFMFPLFLSVRILRHVRIRSDFFQSLFDLSLQLSGHFAHRRVILFDLLSIGEQAVPRSGARMHEVEFSPQLYTDGCDTRPNHSWIWLVQRVYPLLQDVWLVHVRPQAVRPFRQP